MCIGLETRAGENDPVDGQGNIKGTVTTADGKPAADVTVSLQPVNRNTTTSDDGTFMLRNVPAGEHELSISLIGYETVTQKITVLEGKTQIVTIKLELSEKQLEEVVVKAGRHNYRLSNVSTGLRLQTPIKDLPQNIQVVSGKVIADQQIFDMLEGVTRNVSGATKMEHWDNYALINMRGSQIAAFRNGMNVQMPWGPLAEDMSMVEKIEFVKGPAGFMLANGEPSGFYNVVTKKPTGQTKGEVTLSLGSFDTYRGTLDFDGKLSKDGKLLYRLNVMGQMKGSHRDNEFNNRWSVVPVLQYNFNNKTSLTLEYTHQFSEMSTIGSNYAFSKNKLGELPVNFTTLEKNLEPTKINDRSILAIFKHQVNDRWNLTAQMGYYNYKQVGQSLWPWTVEANGNMQRGVSIWDALGTNKIGQFFLTGKERTGSITHKILAGLDVNDMDYWADFNQGGPLGSPDFNIYDPKYGVPASSLPVYDRSLPIKTRGVQYGNQNTSVYVQDELGFFRDRLRLTVAGRYTTAKSQNPYELDPETSGNRITPRVGISYSIDENTSAYAVYDQSYVPNYGTDINHKSFDPMIGTNVEAGIKRDWFNGRWNTTLGVFRINKQNALIADEVDNGVSYNRAIEQQVQGVEFDLRGMVVNNLQLVFNYAFNDAKITKDPKDKSNEGEQVPGTSKHINNAWLTYRAPAGVFKGFGVSLGYQWQVDRSPWYVFDGKSQSLPDYFRVDGGLSWVGNQLSVSVNVNNVLNQYLYSGAYYEWGGGYYYWQAEALRNFRATIAYRF
ncbi:putative TonB-dependent siderophore receptor [Flavihumibacter petaseus NBRC 106054]|uniref:Putative TonB-dependent siderophore receptor n=1 Tax=Flavihumibacter petaseus NBRC 106054 TaxID=1220578 RepID=A0A0E9N747_9BACT|nr:putative TonB-dependent siderophore receptor [Flavihumibacter petaseus NBRC 106054]